MTKTKMNRITSDVANLLAGLGDTADEVAQNLEGAGFRGKPLDCTACPVHDCLRKTISKNDVAFFSVGTENVCLDMPQPWTITLRVSTPAPVAEFIRMFDAGMYRNLIR